MRTKELRTLLSAVLISFLAAGSARAQNTSQAEDPQPLVEKGMQAFQAHSYEQASVLFRQARRADNQVHKLTKADREQLDRMLDESAKAATTYRIAEESMTQAKRAMEQADYAQARKLFTRVVEAGNYVPKSWTQEAKVQLGVLAEKEKTKPAAAPAAKTTGAAPQAAKKAQPGPAAKRAPRAPQADPATCPPAPRKAQAVCPPKPRASAAGECPTPVVASRSEAPRPGQSTLLQEILAARQIQKEQALAAFEEATRRIRQAILEHQYLGARDILRQARLDLQRARRFFTPEEDTRLQMEIDSLARFIETEEQLYQQQLILQQKSEVERKRMEREQQVMQERIEKIRQLMTEARLLVRERKFEEAIERAEQVLVIDPNNDRARWFIEMVQDTGQFAQQKEVHNLIQEQGQEALTEAEETRVPWVDEVTYPKTWQEMTKKRTEILRRTGRAIAGEAPALTTEKKLKQVFIADPAVFRGPLRNAFKVFQSKGIKVFVNWGVLETEGILPDDQVKIEAMEGMKDLSAKTALEILLKTLPSTEIDYAIDTDGVVIVGTKDNIRTQGYKGRLGQLETRVYDIADLMYTTKRRMPELQVEAGDEEGGGGGETLGEDEEDEEEDEEENVGGRAENLVDLIILLVRPETWSPDIEGSIGQGQGTIDLWKRHWLIVYQSAEVHSELEMFLAKMRESQSVQIVLEARFVSVSTGFLEKIGLDLDVVMNSGSAGYDFTGAQETFGDPRLVGVGPGIVQPRQFSYLGALPQSPVGAGGTGSAFPPGYAQPYGVPGLVPQPGNVGPRGARMTPIPIIQGSNALVQPESTTVPGDLASKAVTPAFQVMGAFLDDLQVNFLLEATQLDRYSSITQAPRVVMQNGTEGVIQVGAYQAEVPRIRQVIGSHAGGAEEGTRRGVFFGTTLRVQATSVDLRYVNLYVRPRVSAPDPGLDVTYSLPTVASGMTASAAGYDNSLGGGVGFTTVTRHGRRVQALKTQVSVPDGGTVLIGGLKQSGEVESEAGPPILNKIPVIKRFFSNKVTNKATYTLLVLVKPKIILREEVEPGTAEELLARPLD